MQCACMTCPSVHMSVHEYMTSNVMNFIFMASDFMTPDFMIPDFVTSDFMTFLYLQMYIL